MTNDPELRGADRGNDPLDELLRLARWPETSTDRLDELLRLARWPEPAADPLERCLDKAQWPMPQADQLARGRRQWQRAGLAGKRRQRILALAGIVVAASLLMAIGWCGWQAFRTTPTTHGIPVQIAGGPDSSAIGVPKAQEEAHAKGLQRLRHPDSRAIGATPR